MRIIIAGPPKAGNVWLKCLLGHIYGLRPLGLHETPKRPQFALFKAWAEAGGFPEGTIFHQHYDYSPELVDLIDTLPAHTVTIIRDPYDAFVSSYYNIQNHKEDGLRNGRRTDQIMGKTLDHPDVLAFLRGGGFRNNMVRARQWLESGRTHLVRYENLHSDPVAELRRVADAIALVPDERIERAVAACSADAMRQAGGAKSGHVRAAKVGDSKDKLTDEHLAIFRERHAELIRMLGYDVR
ncbi:MAG TPA: sulfotransferase domain-containing protein [Thermomicrobiales bacterium]|nr:sulfotransferase domain-containing protein [Thermomicrobiales bacterium]